jgi:hypothetical protein
MSSKRNGTRSGYQWHQSVYLTALEEAEVIPGKHSDTRITHLRIKPLDLTNDHGRYITVTPERALASVGKCPLNIYPLIFWPFHFQNGRITAVSLLKPPPESRSGLKNPLGLLESPIYVIVFQGEDDGLGGRSPI